MTGLLAAPVIAAAIGLPHMLRLERAAPPAAIAIWLAALLLRALVSVSFVVLTVAWVPTTELFGNLTGWCWHAVLPLMPAHLHLSGHRIGDLGALVPALVLGLSVTWVLWALLAAARAVGRLLQVGELGAGPCGSVLVGGADVTLAAAGLRRPRVIVSTGALCALDEDELAAGMAHERGHIDRYHRYALLAGVICRGLARFMPGTRRALHELGFHLERDADQYALFQSHDRLSLASAICKTASAPSGPALLALGAGPKVTRRVRLLLADESSPRAGTLRRHAAGALALTMSSLALAALIASPLALAAQAQTASAFKGTTQSRCQS